MATKPLDPILANILVEFQKLPCPLTNLQERGDYVQLRFGPYWAHYEWLLKKPGKLHVAVHFERGKSGSHENLTNAEQLRDKIEVMASAVGAQTELGFWNKHEIWSTAALVFDVPEVINVALANKLASVMVLLVLVTLQEVTQMCDVATIEH
jgi:hypothetical protein